MSKEKLVHTENRGFLKKAARLVREKRGATMVEYAAIVAVILLVAWGAYSKLGKGVNQAINDAAQGFGTQQ